MRKRYRVLILAALVAALVVPVGFALSLESPSPRTRTSSSSTAVISAAALLEPVPDSAKLFLVGTMLFGLAAFVRKAV
jgi:hypothetical protein